MHFKYPYVKTIWVVTISGESLNFFLSLPDNGQIGIISFLIWCKLLFVLYLDRVDLGAQTLRDIVGR